MLRFFQRVNSFQRPTHLVSSFFPSMGYTFQKLRFKINTSYDNPKELLKDFKQIETTPTCLFEEGADSESTDLSGFTTIPSSQFAGGDSNNRGVKLDCNHELVKHFEIRGLERDKVAYVFRGDPRPLEIILKEGITSKLPHSRTNLLVHRYRNEFSSFISFSTKFSVAARFGCLSSIHSTYGIHPTIGNNQFHILYAELPGNQYILAGPSKGPRFFASEFEVTCANTVNPMDIKGFRKCEFTKQRIGQFEQRYATCLNIFVRKGLTPQEEERVTHLLEGQDPKKLETHMQLRK